jgi:hypothetical protein
MSYIKYKRGFEDSALYKNCSLEQLEVIRAIVSKVNYTDGLEVFDGVRTEIKRGDVWLSRVGLLAEVNRRCKSAIKESHVRSAMDKLVKGSYMIAVKKSRISGTIYRCLEQFYTEIAEPFDIRNLTYEQPTINLPLTYEQPTNNLPNSLTNKELKGATTYEQPTNNLPLTADSPHIHQYLKNKEERRKNNNNTIPVENSILDFEKVSLESNLEIERKKVAAKKESFEFPAAPAEFSINPLDAYFSNVDNLEFWAAKYPLLEMESEFEKIKNALNAKAANGDAQMQIPYNYVLKCLNNAEIERQQRIKAQNNQINKPFKVLKNGNDWAKQNGKRIAADKFSNYAAGNGGLIVL